MYIENSFFDAPEQDTSIWRFLDLPKFLNILTTKKLFFSNIFMYDDIFEGHLPRFSDPLNDEVRTAKDGIHIETLEKIENTIRNIIRVNDENSHFKFIEKIFINCWHMNKNESALMWDSYSSRNYGLAIQTTCGNLIRSFDNTENEIYIGKVKYDYEALSVTNLDDKEYNPLKSLTTKRPSFYSENELRVFTSSDNLISNILNRPLEFNREIGMNRNKDGLSVDVDIKKLIENLYISPMAPSYFVDSIKDIINKYDLDPNNIKRSDLYLIE